MTYSGHIENGAVVPDNPVNLPDGTIVEIRAVQLPRGHHHPDVYRFGGILNSNCLEKNDYVVSLREKHA